MVRPSVANGVKIQRVSCLHEIDDGMVLIAWRETPRRPGHSAGLAEEKKEMEEFSQDGVLYRGMVSDESSSKRKETPVSSSTAATKYDDVVEAPEKKLSSGTGEQDDSSSWFSLHGYFKETNCLSGWEKCWDESVLTEGGCFDPSIKKESGHEDPGKHGSEDEKHSTTLELDFLHQLRRQHNLTLTRMNEEDSDKDSPSKPTDESEVPEATVDCFVLPTKKTESKPQVENGKPAVHPRLANSESTGVIAEDAKRQKRRTSVASRLYLAMRCSTVKDTSDSGRREKPPSASRLTPLVSVASSKIPAAASEQERSTSASPPVSSLLLSEKDKMSAAAFKQDLWIKNLYSTAQKHNSHSSKKQSDTLSKNSEPCVKSTDFTFTGELFWPKRVPTSLILDHHAKDNCSLLSGV